MSYTDVQTSPAQRAKAVAVVGGIHALLAVGVATGLTVTGIVAMDDSEFIAVEYDLPDDPPPPPERTVEQSEITPYSPPQAPEPVIVIPTRSPIEVQPMSDTVFDDITTLVPPRGNIVIPQVDSTPVAPAFDPVGPVPSNGPAGWITNSDYPAIDLRRANEGTARYRLVVGSDGRVDACEITASTGSPSLDRTTCRLIERRARFDPALNADRAAVVGTYSGTVSWQIPD